ncbi:glycerate kinase [Aquiflexum sp.]|uniref:glycerate kinase family protein n=1 Tax=Aquiflexum sp. TaxID=1872584 RepID=UPI00359397CB
MNYLIAPNAFKGTIEADEAAAIISDTISKKFPEANIEQCPIADGGDGTCFLLGKELILPQVDLYTLDPLGRSVSGFYFLDKTNKTAYLDVSTVSGIKYLKEYEKNPWTASTYGTGELIRNAISNGAKHIVLGLGGSATVDLGIGILNGLGYLFLDEKGREMPIFSDVLFKNLRHIQSPVQRQDIKITCLCDVNNYFFGEEGAIPVFGPQKGLDLNDFKEFQKSCSNVLDLLSTKSGKEINDQPGFGAAGGIAFGLSFFFPVDIQMGAQWFFEKAGIEEKVKRSDTIITGEGKYDSQSAGGKGSYELLQIAKKHGKNIVLITSGKGGNDAGFDEILILPDLDFDQADFQENARKNLVKCVEAWVESF